MKDPLGVMGKDSIFVMESYYGTNSVKEYEDMAKLKAGVTRKTYKLPYSWYGTGAVVYGSYLYYNRSGNILVFSHVREFAKITNRRIIATHFNNIFVDILPRNSLLFELHNSRGTVFSCKFTVRSY